MAQKAYARTAAYDAAISNWLAERDPRDRAEMARLRRRAARSFRRAALWRESASVARRFYLGRRDAPRRRDGAPGCRARSSPTTTSTTPTPPTNSSPNSIGREPPAVAIIKHANPCGVAIGATLLEAYEKALACDPVSAFGGVVALNRRLDAAAARKIVEIFTEVIIAPEADDEALAIVAAKKNLRLLIAGALPDPRAPDA